MATPPSIPISEAILPSGDPLDVVGGVGHLEGVGVSLDHAADQVDLLGDRPRRVRVLAGDVDRPELGLDAALAESGDVGLAGIQPVREVELLEVEIPLVRNRQGRSLWPSKSIPAAWTFLARSETGGSRSAFPLSSWPSAPAAMDITRTARLAGIQSGASAPPDLDSTRFHGST